MNAPNSNNFRSSQSNRSSSRVSNAPSRLQSTSCCGVATDAIGSICRKPRRRTVSSTVVALPSSNWARTAMRRACARLTVVDFTEFVLSQLSPAPARVLEIGCGPDGGIVSALVEAGHDALGVDPRVPEGDRFRAATFQQLDEGPFDS